VTSATGFVGSAVINFWLCAGKSVVAVVRKDSAEEMWGNRGSNVVLVEVGHTNGDTRWQRA
jgi:uncharacterized protein YbjT (DUF2867 family)